MPDSRERADLRAIKAGLAQLSTVAVRTIGADVGDDLIRSTRRDTGLTANSWRFDLERPSTGESHSRSPSGVSAAKAAQESSRANLALYRVPGALSVNNVEPNSERLNDGLDAGYVPRAIRSGIREATPKVAAEAARQSRRRG